MVSLSSAAQPLLIDPGPSRRGWHRLQSAVECMQKYAFSHDPAGAPRDESTVPFPLALGSLVHVGVAHHHARTRQRQHSLPVDAYYDPLTAVALLAAKKGGDVYREAAEEARVIVENYSNYWSTRETFRVLHVEELFTIRYPIRGAPIRGLDYVEVTARVDLAYEDGRGQTWLADTKTSVRVEPKHQEIYSISGQMLNYRWIGAGLFGDRFGGVLLDMVSTGAPGFTRVPLPPAPALFTRFPRVVEDAERRIVELEDSGRAYNDWPAAASELVCVHRYGKCAFFQRCAWGSGAPV